MPQSEEHFIQVWRNDGVIHFVMPTSCMITMGITLGLSHSPWACHVATEWLALLTKEVLDNDFSATDKRERELIDTVRERHLKAHVPPTPNRTRMIAAHEVEGTMHPVELQAIAASAATQLAGGLGGLAEDSPVYTTLMTFVTAAVRFVRPAEKLALQAKGVDV